MPEFVKLPLVAVLAIGALILLVMAHLVLAAVCEVFLVAAGIAGVRFLRRYMLVVHDVPEPASPPQPIAAPSLHLHLHGVTAEDVAAITQASRRGIQ